MSFSDDEIERLAAAVETMQASLTRLTEAQTHSRSAYHADPDTRDIVERRFLKLTEAALDIAERIVVQEWGNTPETNTEAIRALGDFGVLDDDQTGAMVQAARFRNVLAHMYGSDIDHDLV
ncbi:MAG: DUF86 domain-containing protein, partial [Halobaculum sp.]